MKDLESLIIHVVHGLPASGKSTWIHNLVETDRNKYTKKYRVLDADEQFKYYERNTKGSKTFEDFLKHAFDWSIGCLRSNEELLIDGLFLTNDAIIAVLSMAIEVYMSRVRIDTVSIVIENWNEDREQCVINDKLRSRSEKAKCTIENAPWEKIDRHKIKKALLNKFPIDIELSVKSHYVYTPSKVDVLVAEQGYYIKDRKIYSKSWCGGGTCGSCYGDVMHVSAEKPLMYFEELFDVTEALGVELSARYYFKLMDDLVTTECNTTSDYYGGSVDYYSYVCNIDDLYDWLLTNKLLKDT